MNFDLCVDDLSSIFWRRLLRLSAWDAAKIVRRCIEDGAQCEKDRPAMEASTGSVPLATSVWLQLLTAHLKPKHTIEVGTFIGKSTIAMAGGMGGGTILTCDKSNDIPERLLHMASRRGVNIGFHPKASSTEMLAPLDASLCQTDLFFFDGRIQSDDLPHIRRLSHPQTIYAFDDFEGVQKGVVNAGRLYGDGLQLITPPDPALLLPFGVADRSTLALLIPTAMMRVTAQ